MPDTLDKTPEQDTSNWTTVNLPNGRQFKFPPTWDRDEMAVWLYSKVPELRVRTAETPLEARQLMFKGLMNEVWEKHQGKGHSLDSLELGALSVSPASKDFDFLRSIKEASATETEVGGTRVVLPQFSLNDELFAFAPDTTFKVDPKTGLVDFEMPVKFSPNLHPEADLPSRAALLRGTKPPAMPPEWLERFFTPDNNGVLNQAIRQWRELRPPSPTDPPDTQYIYR